MPAFAFAKNTLSAGSLAKIVPTTSCTWTDIACHTSSCAHRPRSAVTCSASTTRGSRARPASSVSLRQMFSVPNSRDPPTRSVGIFSAGCPPNVGGVHAREVVHDDELEGHAELVREDRGHPREVRAASSDELNPIVMAHGTLREGVQRGSVRISSRAASVGSPSASMRCAVTTLWGQPMTCAKNGGGLGFAADDGSTFAWKRAPSAEA